MNIRRRSFLKCSLVGGIATLLPSFAIGEKHTHRELPRPDTTQFQTGDLVWPKKPGAFVPYNSGSDNTPSQDQKQWINERNEYIETYQLKLLNDSEKRRIKSLRNMSYREFLAIYAGGQEPGVPGAYSGGSVYVGHVGIIEVDSENKPWVIEALLEKGVVRSSYSDWISQRSDQVVWHGRLRQVEENDRSKIVQIAKLHLKKPYDFWNFNLNDDSGFYCSKLIWLCIYRSLGFAIDGDSNPNRKFWFSPKQLLYLPTISRLHDPGPYAFS